MTPLSDIAGHWPAANRLLDEALSLPPDLRETWLAALPAEHAPLKDILVRLLAVQADIGTSDFLGTLPKLHLGSERPDPGDAAAGDTVGPWRLLREVGAGGMGSVWLAERADGSLKRQVALKLPRLTWARGLAERMARERDILATLEHPHIGRLYDAGLDQFGRPWLALEYVPGQPIDVFCRDKALTVRQRIALLLQVCEAVAYAHSRLVIHRDLKPSNILVTDDGQVRLLDFGIAKLVQGDKTEASALTEMVGRSMTLDYASPEQVRGEALGTSSDVYSLGVVAYELLAGVKPYKLKRGSVAELEEAIEQADVALASRATPDALARRALRGDIDAVLRKALEKDAARRYLTIDALSQDLQRHLRGQAVQARPDRLAYRLHKFALRHRWSIAGATAVILALSGGLLAALWQARIAQAQALAASNALERESAIKTLYVETLSSVAGWDTARFAQEGSIARLLREKADAAGTSLADRPEQRLAVLDAVAAQLPFMGDYEGALAIARQSLALLKAAPADAPRLLRTYLAIARTLSSLGRSSEAEATLREALSSVAVDNDLTARLERLRVQGNLGSVLIDRGKRVEAGVLLRGALQQLQALPGQNSPERDLLRSEVLADLSGAALGIDDLAAVQYAERALAVSRAQPAIPVSDLGARYAQAALTLATVGRLAQAEAAQRRSLQANEEIFGPHDRDSVRSLARLAGVLAAQGQHDEARRLLAERRDALLQRAGPDTAGMLVTLQSRQLENEMLYGDVVAAARFATVAQAAELRQPGAADMATYIVQQARLMGWTGRTDEGLRRTSEWLGPPDTSKPASPGTLRVQAALLELRLPQLAPKAAAAEAEALVQTLQRHQATTTWLYRESVERLALTLANSGDGARGASLLRDLGATPVWAALQPPSRAAAADSALRRAEVYLQAGRPDEARQVAATLTSDLQGQHPASPRVTAARALRQALGLSQAAPP